MTGSTEFKKRAAGFLNGTGGSLKTQMLRSGFWVGVSSIGSNILVLARSIVLARILAPEVFGLMAICLVIIRSLDLFTETGYGAALIHRQKGFEEAKDTAFTLLVLRGLALTAITVLIAPVAASYYEITLLDSLVKVIALSFIIGGFYNINAVSYQKNLDFRRLTYLELLQNAANTAAVVAMAFYLRSVWALVLGHVTASVLGVVISYMLIPGRPRFRLDFNIAKELFSYGKFITGLTIVVFFTIEMGTFVIGKVSGMEALGYYVIAFTLANLPTSHFSKIVSRIVFPVYSKLQGDMALLRETYFKVLRVVSMVAIPASAGLAVLSTEIIEVVYGKNWLPAADALKVLALFGCIRAISSLNGYVYNAIGKPGISFYINAIRFAVSAVMIYPMTLWYGITGAALTLTSAIALEFLIGSAYLSRTIGLPIRRAGAGLLRATLLSLGMSAALFHIKDYMDVNVYSLAALIAAGAGMYILFNIRELFSIFRERSLPA